ncbi:MAG: WG repeat-containing protein, partial [Acidobacteriota bacterium]
RVIARFEPPLSANYDFFEGLMPTSGPDGKSGYVDRDGHWVIEPRFYVARPFQEGHAVVRESVDGPWRLIDREGRFVGPAVRYGIESFRHGLAPLQSAYGELAGYIDPTGRWRIPQRYQTARPFSSEDRLALVRAPEGLWGYIDTDGEYRIEPRYIRATGFRHGRASVVEGGPCWIAVEMNLYSPTRFLMLDGAGGTRPSPARPETGEECRMKLIGPQGRTFKAGVQYFKDFTSVGVSAKAAGRWGIVGRHGEWVTPPVWDKVGPFSEGFARVYQDRRGWGFVDEVGNLVIDPAYASVLDFSDGLAAAVTRERKRIYICRDGSQAFPREFEGLGQFRRGIAHVSTGP